MDGGVQPAAIASRPLVLWQDTDAHVRGQSVVGEGENTSGVNPVRTRYLSDKVWNYTPHITGVSGLGITISDGQQHRNRDDEGEKLQELH